MRRRQSEIGVARHLQLFFRVVRLDERKVTPLQGASPRPLGVVVGWFHRFTSNERENFGR
jgi:hypothetical protein